ncbi:AraC-like DNA-binding protein [Erwinia toletana]|uniref:AraC-like DNA-binding protein n=1 Tax=Winslowiella toletana TaxID=92490 RepID=A0ABS4P682_9GAMM|nr:AraC family transcriptional regulator [Winslowiella toletana]MBP2167606.1 AraC-like DNA-binding protein [Winslowiella toletana]
MLIPVNFMLSFCFLLLLLRTLLRQRDARFFVALLVLCILHYLLAGVREICPHAFVVRLLPVTAMALPLLCWLALRQAGAQSAPLLWLQAPLSLMALCVWQWPQGIDALLLVTYLACAAAMLSGLAKGEAAFAPQTLALSSWRLIAVMLICCALLDLAVTADISLSDGLWQRALLLTGQVLLCLVIGLALAITPVVSLTKPESSSREADENDEQVFAAVEQLMRDHALYRDSGLNLAKLARKSGIPSRKVSAAINLMRQQSVSQYVNQWRIEEACRLLSHSSLPIIEIMEAAGFVTKSNFNREFLRITGKTPSQWRTAQFVAGNISGTRC